MYSGSKNGFRRIWREKFNAAHIHLDDRDHRLETLLSKVRGEGTWLDDYLERLHQVISLFQTSGLLKRQLRRASAQLEEVSVSLQRLVETRFVEYLVLAVSKVLHNRAAMVNVLQDMLSQETLFSGVAHRVLRTLHSQEFLLSSLVVVDLMTPAVTLSKAGQAAVYTIFQDQRAVKRYLSALKQMTEGSFSGQLEKEGSDVTAGTFRGAEVSFPARYKTRRTSHSDDGQADCTGGGDRMELPDAIQRRHDVAAAILERSHEYLDATDGEKLICHVFDFEKIMAGGGSDYGETEFSDLARKLTTGNLTLPARPCSEGCLGVDCHCLRSQYRTFKRRVIERSSEGDIQAVWLPTDTSSGVRSWRTENVLRSFQDVRLGLHKDIPDVVEVAEICLLMSRSQSDTERVGKTAKRVSEGRFEGKFNKQKDDDKDRSKKEVFIIENSVPLRYFPAKTVAEKWTKEHRPALKRTVTDDKSLTVKRLNRAPKRLKFMFEV